MPVPPPRHAPAPDQRGSRRAAGRPCPPTTRRAAPAAPARPAATLSRWRGGVARAPPPPRSSRREYGGAAFEPGGAALGGRAARLFGVGGRRPTARIAAPRVWARRRAGAGGGA